MKKKILISVLIIILVIIGVFAIWQWDNIYAVIDGIRYDEQELAQKTVAAEQKVDEYFEKNNLNKITPMTPEQEQALQNGEISSEDAVKIMTGAISFEEAKENSGASAESDSSEGHSGEVSEKADDEQSENSYAAEKDESKPESNSGTPAAVSETKSSGTDYDSLISEKVAELYVVRSNFYSSFNAKYSAARAAFLARPKSERTKANLAAAVRSYIPEGLAMEKDCDSQVEAILSELKVLLRQAGRDESLVESIRSAYNSEKSSMKSSLISKYF